MALQLEQFVEDLKEAHGGNLFSVVLYGSGGKSNGGLSSAPETKGGHRLLVVLNRIAPADLKRVRSLIQKWNAGGNPIPVYFTHEEIDDAADVFPIEFIDMSEARRVLAGKDPFAALTVPSHNLRHQVEYELRSKLIRLRALYLPASSKPDRLARLMVDSLDSFAGLLRHVIKLIGGGELPSDGTESIKRLSQILDLDESVFGRIHQYAAEEGLLLEMETEETFARYIVQIEKIVEAVDKLPDQN
ncbi:MAG TPA: hypothetical protein VJX67_07540 [Blastocatellia bacterium]|nr:hypothetical protein [Blastocatellia bacterium]